MTTLSDHDLKRRLALRTPSRIVVEPLGEDAIQPASIDIRLGDRLLVRDNAGEADPWDPASARWVEAPFEDGRWCLWPGTLYLGATLERIEVPADLVCQLHGRSSLGRQGIVIHQTAGLVDPGWRGNLTLEITVTDPTALRPGGPIGQLTFDWLPTPCDRLYRGRYQGDREPVPARPFVENRR